VKDTRGVYRPWQDDALERRRAKSSTRIIRQVTDEGHKPIVKLTRTPDAFENEPKAMALILVILRDDERPEQQRSRNAANGDRREVHRSDNLAFENGAKIEPGIVHRALAHAVGGTRETARAKSSFVQIDQGGIVIGNLQPDQGGRHRHRANLIGTKIWVKKACLAQAE